MYSTSHQSIQCLIVSEA